MYKRFLSIFMSLIFVFNTGCYKSNVNEKENIESEDVSISIEPTLPKKEDYEKEEIEVIFEEEPPEIKEIVISAVGDCTLGTDSNFGYSRTFTEVLDNQNRDFSYFFSGVSSVLKSDDLSIANLEGTFTDSNVKRDKQFNFKGDLDYVNILTTGSVEAVNLANNHTYDYNEEGYNDTIEVLKNASVNYFGYQDYSIVNVKGINIGLAGITGWSEASAKSETEKAINYFKENETDLIIMNYHWGVERDYKQNSDQENIARYAIENGADLVLGHHPHVLQGVECYNGKYIVYSLGNFVFGGNKNPSDKDTMIVQVKYTYTDGVLTDTKLSIIPCSLSSVSNVNDYKPIILESEEKSRVLKKVLDSSTNFSY